LPRPAWSGFWTPVDTASVDFGSDGRGAAARSGRGGRGRLGRPALEGESGGPQPTSALAISAGTGLDSVARGFRADLVSVGDRARSSSSVHRKRRYAEIGFLSDPRWNGWHSRRRFGLRASVPRRPAMLLGAVLRDRHVYRQPRLRFECTRATDHLRYRCRPMRGVPQRRRLHHCGAGHQLREQRLYLEARRRQPKQHLS
jgi:hypothetical protein